MLLQFFKDYPALVSLIAVAIGWFATRRGQIHGDRAKHSHSYLGILDTKEYLVTLKTISPLLDKKSVYVEKDHTESERAKLSQALWDCLQLMERAAIDIDMGYISEEYFFKKYRTLIERLFLVSHHFINEIRNEKKSGTFYKNLQTLHIRMRFRSKPLLLRTLEYIKVCPNFRASTAIFAAHLRTLNRGFIPFMFEICRYRTLPTEITYMGLGEIEAFQNLFKRRIRMVMAIEAVVMVVLATAIYRHL